MLKRPGAQKVKARISVVIAVLASVIALASARPYAGCWNDGSRLATVESLIDHGTFVIDASVFVHPPRPPAPNPYPDDDPGLQQSGTQDKLFINRHYYSDKSPVPGVLMAGAYQLWQWLTGWTAHTHPAAFCRDMTLVSSGLAFVLAVVGTWRLAVMLGLRPGLGLSLTASFALATVAVPYARHVNNHIVLLAVGVWLAVDVAGRRGASWGRLLRMGTLAGLGYTIDLGTGPVIFTATAVLVLVRCRKPVVLGFFVAALPWMGLHHALNYAIGGTWRPANAVPEHFTWPGSPFHAGNLTGGLAHPSLGSLALYALSMIFGKRGFLGHNLPLFLLVPAAWWMLRRYRGQRPEVLWGLGCCLGTWVLYATSSNNSSGRCLSIRWFVPLLGPAYLVLGQFLRRYRRYRADFVLLSAWGMVLAALMYEGPWSVHAVPCFWPIQAAALVTWAALRARLAQPSTATVVVRAAAEFAMSGIDHGHDERPPAPTARAETSTVGLESSC